MGNLFLSYKGEKSQVHYGMTLEVVVNYVVQKMYESRSPKFLHLQGRGACTCDASGVGMRLSILPLLY